MPIYVFFQDEDLKDASRLGDSKDEKVNGMIKKQPQKKGILKTIFWGYLLPEHSSFCFNFDIEMVVLSGC